MKNLNSQRQDSPLSRGLLTSSIELNSDMTKSAHYNKFVDTELVLNDYTQRVGYTIYCLWSHSMNTIRGDSPSCEYANYYWGAPSTSRRLSARYPGTRYTQSEPGQGAEKYASPPYPWLIPLLREPMRRRLGLTEVQRWSITIALARGPPLHTSLSQIR